MINNNFLYRTSDNHTFFPIFISIDEEWIAESEYRQIKYVNIPDMSNTQQIALLDYLKGLYKQKTITFDGVSNGVTNGSGDNVDNMPILLPRLNFSDLLSRPVSVDVEAKTNTVRRPRKNTPRNNGSNSQS